MKNCEKMNRYNKTKKEISNSKFQWKQLAHVLRKENKNRNSCMSRIVYWIEWERKRETEKSEDHASLKPWNKK